jgi:regulatory protein YycI of two-component signal transduction system YycFG
MSGLFILIIVLFAILLLSKLVNKKESKSEYDFGDGNKVTSDHRPNHAYHSDGVEKKSKELALYAYNKNKYDNIEKAIDGKNFCKLDFTPNTWDFTKEFIRNDCLEYSYTQIVIKYGDEWLGDSELDNIDNIVFNIN